MKKIISLIIVCCLLLGACASNDEDSEYITPSEQAEIWGEQTIAAFMNKDIELLKGLFNKKMHDKYDLDGEILKLFDYIDGEIVSYGELFGDTNGGEMRGEEGKVQEGVFCRIKDVKTDKGKTYTISISAYTIYKDDEEYLGVDGISIRDVELFESDDTNPDAVIRLKYE